MKKRFLLDFDPIILITQNWVRNHILQPQLPIQISYVVCRYAQYTDILFTYKVPDANTHVPHYTQRENDTTIGGGAAPIGTIGPPICVRPKYNEKSYSSATIAHTEIICTVYTCLIHKTYYSGAKCLRLILMCHTTHTKGGTDSTDGGKPPLVVSFSLCVWCGTCVLASGILYVNNMSVYYTYMHTTYDFCLGKRGWRIWFLSQFWLTSMHYGLICVCIRNMILETIWAEKTRFSKVLFMPRDPAKNFRHDVRISLVQFSASELHEVSRYGHLKVEEVKIRLWRRQHLLRLCFRFMMSQKAYSKHQSATSGPTKP